MPRFKRRKLLVSRAQYRLLGFNILYYVVFAATFSAGIWAPVAFSFLDEASSGEERESSAHLLLYLHDKIWLVGGLLVVLLSMHSVVVSHRVLGPLVRFKARFREVRSGRLAGQIRLRENDYLHEEARVLNEMTTGLSELLRSVEDSFREVESELEGVRRAFRSEHTEEVEARLRSLELELEAYRQAWSHIDLGGAVEHVDEHTLEQLPSLRPGTSSVPKAGRSVAEGPGRP